jgi:hypothetical protein
MEHKHHHDNECGDHCHDEKNEDVKDDISNYKKNGNSEYECLLCPYSNRKKYKFEKHLKTQKHNKNYKNND